MSYLVQLCVHYKEDVLNPEAKAISESAAQLGFDLSDLVWGKYCSYVSSKKSRKAAEEEARGICDQLFANPVMETYEIMSVKRLQKKNKEQKVNKEQKIDNIEEKIN